MKTTKGDGKIINIAIPEDVHYNLKVKAALENVTIKELVAKLIRDYLYDKEPIDDEERLAIEKGKKAIAEGKMIPFQKIKEKFGV